MKRPFHKGWNVIRRITGIVMCFLCIITLLPILQAEGAGIQNATRSVLPTTLATSTAELHSDTLAPDAVQQFAREQAIILSTEHEGNHWDHAQLDFYPLGPGTRSWLVYANVGESPVGYMIISANEQGQLQLSEYGQGEQRPYNISLLDQALDRQQLDLKKMINDGGGLQLRYAPPLLAYWKVERPNDDAIYIDATNGDTLPTGILDALDTDSRQATSRMKFIRSISVQAVVMTPEDSPQVSSLSLSVDSMDLQPLFDPADNLLWITSKALSINGVKTLNQQWKEHKKIVFSADEKNVLYGGALPVSGYQIWRDDRGTVQKQYVAIGGNTSVRRFVPLQTLLRDGHFYAVKP
ncbi:hypothetical protein SAMN06272722_102847 [Paenibacillus sp. RU5A]|nr:hypothetical protein SAMN06272722_102847 [Paenibacillus sp. RU5A]SOC66668.1 hypothetical protein SAMN05880581_102150 [Paenibacillus sp. RU26A]SOC70267.1 hypothetical protein SAMN05880586_102847 [Paenibacillus sp. RU5M]